MSKNIIALGLAVVAVVIAIAALVAPIAAPTPGGTTQGYTDSKQGFRVNGTEVISSLRAAVFQTFTQGGGVFSTTSQGTVTYPATAFDTESVIEHTASGATTATLPASSTLTSFIPTAGQSRTVCINAITTKLTLAGGTGTDLNTASSTKDIIAGGLGCLNFVRKSNTDIEVLLTTGI